MHYTPALARELARLIAHLARDGIVSWAAGRGGYGDEKPQGKPGRSGSPRASAEGTPTSTALCSTFRAEKKHRFRSPVMSRFILGAFSCAVCAIFFGWSGRVLGVWLKRNHVSLFLLRRLQDVADRYVERVSSLEGTLLEGKAALAAVEASRSSIALELADAKEAMAVMGQQKEEMAEGKVREEALRLEIDAINKTLQVNKRQGPQTEAWLHDFA